MSASRSGAAFWRARVDRRVLREAEQTVRIEPVGGGRRERRRLHGLRARTRGPRAPGRRWSAPPRRRAMSARRRGCGRRRSGRRRGCRRRRRCAAWTRSRGAGGGDSDGMAGFGVRTRTQPTRPRAPVAAMTRPAFRIRDQKGSRGRPTREKRLRPPSRIHKGICARSRAAGAPGRVRSRLLARTVAPAAAAAIFLRRVRQIERARAPKARPGASSGRAPRAGGHAPC